MRDDLSALFVADGERDPHKAAQRDLKRPLPKKFYKDVSVTPLDEGFGLALDGRPVRTPARAPLAVPNKILAELWPTNGGGRASASTRRPCRRRVWSIPRSTAWRGKSTR